MLNVDSGFHPTQGLCETFSGQADIGISRLEQLLPRAEKVGWYVDDVLRALIRAHEKAGDLPRALEYVDQLTLYFGAMRTRQLHQQLAQIQQEALGELDAAAHAEALLGEQAADLRVRSFNQTLADRERTLLLPVALAEELPARETGELVARLRDQIGVALDRVVVNAMQPAPFPPELPDLDRRLAALAATPGPPPATWAACAAHLASRHALNRHFRDEIDARTGLRVFELPLLEATRWVVAT